MMSEGGFTPPRRLRRRPSPSRGGLGNSATPEQNPVRIVAAIPSPFTRAAPARRETIMAQLIMPTLLGIVAPVGGIAWLLLHTM
ncbi:hypothetical protein EV668_4429 [Enterovirga rhinocerotis]|uniref:Uncharacterized protein n=1 Tax=Enterovirga rhinocerotis TaxID=1339210 RepID=A0A4R7BP94_9HYPH|nr:hypothetical protein EV668_4429 [Enterovirga rhinocerotis]